MKKILQPTLHNHNTMLSAVDLKGVALKKPKHLTQYSTRLNIPELELSNEQIKIRKDIPKYIYGKTMVCKRCGKLQNINEFYLKLKKEPNGRRDTTCRDCRMRTYGVIEVGKTRFSIKILHKGFRRCSICKNIKPLNKYTKSKNSFGGYSHSCYKCQHELTHKYIINQRKNIGTHYIKQYALLNYGLRINNKNQFNKFRKEIEEKRKPKFFIDDGEFVIIGDLARYLLKKYNVPITTTESRIKNGHSEKDCLIPENEFRSKGNTYGKIKVIDTITKKTFFFKQSTDLELHKMFSTSAITRAIKTRTSTTITSLSKYPNPCTIERI